MTQLLVIESVSIRQDAHGRYSLNDLHKAAMANGRATESQKPSEFLSSQGVQAFVAAVDAGLRVQKGGSNQGTWSSREILLKYAAWLHPEIESAIYKKITDIEANIASESYFTAADGVTGSSIGKPGASLLPEYVTYEGSPLSLLTFCVIVLRNGFTVTGESACASPENFDAELCRKIARSNAVAKIWHGP